MDFRQQADQLGRLIAPAQLHPRAHTTTAESAARREYWLVACSGGSDSVALLLLVWAHWPQQRERITVVHFNHCLRGTESDADEQFCRELCENLGLKFEVGAWTDAPVSASEDAARTARYSFFECVAKKVGASLLFTGHQKDDIAETQLMRLSRGSSSGGLSGPRPVRDWSDQRKLVRPLLTHSRDEIRNALRQTGIRWREDSSNDTDHYQRNRVRRHVVPGWVQATGQRALDGAALSREWLEQDDQALEQWLDELGLHRQVTRIDFCLFAGRPIGLWRRALRRWTPGVGLDRRAFDELLTICQSGQGRLSVGDGFAEVHNGVLDWIRPANDRPRAWSARWHIGTTLCLPSGARLTGARIEPSPALLERLFRGEIDPAVNAILAVRSDTFIVRTWQPGDRYRPLGAPGSAKLQDLFVNRKVPEPERLFLPVVGTEAGEILWVPGFPLADDSKVTDNSVTVVQLTYTSGTSTVRN